MVKKSIKTSLISAKPAANTLKALDAALARERRPQMRKRLLTIRALLATTTFAEASRITGACPRSVSQWSARYRRNGLAGLLEDRRGVPRTGRRKLTITPHEAAAGLDAISSALEANNLDILKRRRLLLVAAVLRGKHLDVAARDFGAAPSTAFIWVRNFQRHGIARLLGKSRHWPSATIAADAKHLRALAAQATDRRIAKRLRVVALLAEGVGSLDAGARERVNECTVRRWRERFLTGGIEALGGRA
jgi:transposase